MSHPQAQLASVLDTFGPGPLLVHSDLMRARSFVGKLTSRDQLLSSHDQVLHNVAAGRSIWTPCFNYDYTKTGIVDLRSAPCQVGPYGEFRRQQPEVWRSPDPVFSTCGVGPAPIETLPSGSCRAFDQQSIFAELYRRDGTLLFYGAPFSSATVLHYAEMLTGGPIYRYDKIFTGKLIDLAGTETAIDYIYHVRPWERHLDYDWPRLAGELVAERVLIDIEHGKQTAAQVASARGLVDFWVAAIERDPLYLLDEPSRQWVAPLYEQLNRRFEITDFE